MEVTRWVKRDCARKRDIGEHASSVGLRTIGDRINARWNARRAATPMGPTRAPPTQASRPTPYVVGPAKFRLPSRQSEFRRADSYHYQMKLVRSAERRAVATYAGSTVLQLKRCHAKDVGSLAGRSHAIVTPNTVVNARSARAPMRAAVRQLRRSSTGGSTASTSTTSHRSTRTDSRYAGGVCSRARTITPVTFAA